jgi:hypothetical protein
VWDIPHAGRAGHGRTGFSAWYANCYLIGVEAAMKRPDPKLDRRMLAVDDPVEMKTEPGSEILIAATPEEHAEDADDETGIRDRDGETPARRLIRESSVHIRGVGEVA